MKDCKNSTAGTTADGGALDECQAFSSSVEKGVGIGSMEFVCYGRGVSSVEGTMTSTTEGYGAATSNPSYTSGEGTTGDNEDDEDEHHSSSGCCQCECCCCCVVM